MRQFHINKFAGQNIKKDPLKIPVGEFSSIVGLRPDKDIIETFKEPKDVKIPVPVLKFANFGLELEDLQTQTFNTTPLSVGPYGTAKSIVALKVSGSLAANEIITLFTGATYAGTPVKLSIYADDAGGTIPGTNVSLFSDYTQTSSLSPSPAYVGLVNAPSQALSTSYWVGFESSTTNNLLNSKLYHGAGSGTDSWQVWNGASWEAFSIAFPAIVSRPFFFVVGSSLETAPDDMKLVKMPYKSSQEDLTTTGNDFTKLTQISFNNMCTVGAENTTEGTTQNIIFRPGKFSMPLGSAQTVTTMSNTLFVLKDGVVAATANNTQYCVPIILQKYIYTILGGASEEVQEYRKLEISYFNGSLIVAGYGPDKTSHSPCYYQMNQIPSDLQGNESNGAVGYDTVDTLPELPKKVNIFNRTILFSNTHDFPFRSYYGLPGTFSGFDSAINILNITDGNAILAIEKYGSKLLYFTHHEVLALGGVPGLNATLHTIKTTGILGEFSLKLTAKGLFCGLSDGLFLYTGSFLEIPDHWGLFEEKEQRIEPYYLRFVDYPSEEELYFFEKDIVNPGNISRIVNILNYHTGEGYSKPINLIEETSVATESADFLKTQIVFFEGNQARQHEGDDEKYSRISADTGWIDVDPNMEFKQFKDIAIEVYTTRVNVPLYVAAITDTGGFKTFILDFIDNNVIIKRIKQNFNFSGRLIKFHISGLATTDEQIKISRISTYYNEGKLTP